MAEIIIIIIIRISLSIISTLVPIRNNRIFFSSFSGENFACNPLYIFRSLSGNKNNIECFILKSKNNEIILDNHLEKIKVRTINKNTLKYFYLLFSSKILITNDYFSSYIPKKKEQYLINTWHGGGAYKRVNAKNKIQERLYKILYYHTNYFLSSCRKFSEVMSKDLYINIYKFLPCGMPRNDLFFNKENVEKANKIVRKKYNINNDESIILYAPTWRDDSREIINKITEINALRAFEKMMNKKIKLLLRAHYHTKHYILYSNCVDVTDYPDMQELLCAADILITDYSSCMWDFSLMYKPCFIYATDIDQYKKERDFYTPMSEWPFPIATNTDELINNIINFNEPEYIEKIKKHHQALGSYEDGHACERVCKLIEDIIDGKV